MNVLFSLDGVLRSDTGELVSDGLFVYRTMKTLGRVVLFTALERQAADVWLMMHNLADYDDLIDSSVVLDPAEPLSERQFAVARSKGTVSFYVDADPGACAYALRQGVPTFLFSTPAYARPEFRPDAPKGVRRWDDLIAERTRQQALKAADVRLKNDEDLRFE